MSLLLGASLLAGFGFEFEDELMVNGDAIEIVVVLFLLSDGHQL